MFVMSKEDDNIIDVYECVIRMKNWCFWWFYWFWFVTQASWPPGTECVAKYNFQGSTEQDLPFCKGDLLTIIGVTKVTTNENHLGYSNVRLTSEGECLLWWLHLLIQDPNWYKAKNTVGREGTIPANYVQKREGVKSGGKLSLMPWVFIWTSPSDTSFT